MIFPPVPELSLQMYFRFSSFFLPSQDVVPAAKEAYVKETGKKCDIVVDETNFLLADRYLLACLIPTTQVLIIYSMWNGMREHLDTKVGLTHDKNGTRSWKIEIGVSLN